MINRINDFEERMIFIEEQLKIKKLFKKSANYTTSKPEPKTEEKKL